jgi:hypothetical protein
MATMKELLKAKQEKRLLDKAERLSHGRKNDPRSQSDVFAIKNVRSAMKPGKMR